jgi:hypothetical protein
MLHNKHADEEYSVNVMPSQNFEEKKASIFVSTVIR